MRNPAYPHAPRPVDHQPDATAGYWHHSKQNTLPQPDMIGTYQRHNPFAPEGVKDRKALIIGGGIAGLAAAFYLIRDGHMPGANITVYDALPVSGGSMDGAGNPEDGYIVRGGREMNWNYDQLWDMLQDVQALELPEGYSACTSCSMSHSWS